MRIFVFFPLLLLSGCINSKAIDYLAVDDAKGNDILNVATKFCGSIGKLTQSCDAWQGANLQIEISNQKMRIAGNQDGDLILIMHSKDVCGFGESCVNRENNDSYAIVKETLMNHGVTINHVNAVGLNNFISGYLIAVNGDAYSVLKAYANQ